MIYSRYFIALAIAVAAFAMTVALQPSAVINEQIAAFVKQYKSTAGVGYISSMYDMCAYGSAGYAQNPTGPAFDPNGRLEMGSLTKSMTAVLLAQLLGQGKIKNQKPSIAPDYGWDSTLSMVFPSMAADTPYENVTLAAVSSMYGGLPANPNHWNFYSPNISLMQQRANLTEYALKSTPVSAWPNTTYLYSNWGFVVLGHIAEVTMNVSWEDLLIEYLIVPLEMSDT